MVCSLFSEEVVDKGGGDSIPPEDITVATDVVVGAAVVEFTVLFC